MFVPTRPKTAGEKGSARTVRTDTHGAEEMNHWAWTGWMPEAEHALPSTALRPTGRGPAMLAA